VERKWRGEGGAGEMEVVWGEKSVSEGGTKQEVRKRRR